jgi:hypothetical protein
MHRKLIKVTDQHERLPMSQRHLQTTGAPRRLYTFHVRGQGQRILATHVRDVGNGRTIRKYQVLESGYQCCYLKLTNDARIREKKRSFTGFYVFYVYELTSERFLDANQISSFILRGK